MEFSNSLDDLDASMSSPDMSKRTSIAIMSAGDDQDEASVPLLRLNTELSLSLNPGYKIVFDNLDKNIKPRYMRSDSQTKSLHYVQSYTVRDRIDFSAFSDQPPTEVNAFDVLPSQDDYNLLKADFSVLISRLIVKCEPISDFNAIHAKNKN